MIQKIRSVILILLLFVFFTSPEIAFAADQTITCTNNVSCSGINTIFSLSEISAGSSFTRSVAIDNRRNHTLDINLTAEKVATTDDDLLKLLDVVVKEVGHQTFFSDTLETFLDSSTSIYLGGVSANETKQLTITVSLPTGTQNYQDKEANFDLNFALSEDVSVHTSTSTTTTPSTSPVLGFTTTATSTTASPSPVASIQPTPLKNSPSPAPSTSEPEVLGTQSSQYTWVFYLGLLFVILAIIILLTLMIRKIRRTRTK